MARIDVEDKRLNLVRDGKVSEVKREESGGDNGNILNSLRLVPKFNEKEVEVFFTLFERVADARGWDNVDRTVLLQCVLTGRAQGAFASLSARDSTDYAKVKAAVLRTYELVPEAYRLRFRSWQRGPDQSYLEFARDLSTHFERWCMASGVEDYDDLAALMVLEQFKNSVPEPVALYISEQKAKTAAEAAALADEFSLTHKGWGDNCGFAGGSRGGREAGQVIGGKYIPPKSSGNVNSENSGPAGHVSENVCHYCHLSGHWKRECPALEGRDKNAGVKGKPAGLAATLPGAGDVNQMITTEVPVLSTPDKSFLPYLSEGHVSMVSGGEKVPVTILRDTGALDSFILSSALPFSEESQTGSFLPVLGMEMAVFHVPVHKLMLHSPLFDGEVCMGVRPALPVKGVTVVLGNDVAGGRVFADQTVQPLQPTEPAYLSNLPVSISHAELVREQKADPTLNDLFNCVLPKQDVNNLAQGYFIEDGVLLRKCVPHGHGFSAGDPIVQIVIPSRFRETVLRSAHYESGHRGVRKTYELVFTKFFWPHVKRSVAMYIRSCHTCHTPETQSQSKVPDWVPNLEISQPKSAEVNGYLGRNSVQFSSKVATKFSEPVSIKSVNVKFVKPLPYRHNTQVCSHPVCICNAHRKEKHGKINWQTDIKVP